MNGKTTDKENQSQYHVKLTQKETPQKAFLSVPRVTRKDRQAPGLWSSCRCRVRTSLYRWAASVATVQQQSPPPPPPRQRLRDRTPKRSYSKCSVPRYATHVSHSMPTNKYQCQKKGYFTDPECCCCRVKASRRVRSNNKNGF